jgi:hypothetical protein
VKIFADATHGATGTFVVVNAGTIESTGTSGLSTDHQAIDFSDLTTATHTTITNQSTGLIQAATGDAIEPGANATINNYGRIVSLSSGDGINFQSNSGGVVNNFAGLRPWFCFLPEFRCDMKPPSGRDGLGKR